MSEKAPGAFRTISEAAEEIGVPAHVLRFWEAKFGALRPMRRAGGRRLYRPEELRTLQALVLLLHGQGFSIGELQGLTRKRLLELADSHRPTSELSTPDEPLATAVALQTALEDAIRAKARLDALLNGSAN